MITQKIMSTEGDVPSDQSDVTGTVATDIHATDPITDTNILHSPLTPQNLRERALSHALPLIGKYTDLLGDITTMIHHKNIMDINDLWNLPHHVFEKLQYEINIKSTNKYT